MAWESLLTINSYYDGPILGVAEFGGQPHIYERVFDEKEDEWSDQFLLAPIEPSLLALVLESWDIWLRWDAAFRAGKTGIETHPALPSDRQRHDALKALVGNRFTAKLANAQTARARFRSSEGDRRPTQVEWII